MSFISPVVSRETGLLSNQGEKSIHFYFINGSCKKKVLKYGTPKPRKRRSRRTSAGNRLQDLICTANRNRNLSGKPLFRLTKSRGGGVNVAFGAEGGPTEGFATTFDVGGGPPEPFEIPLAAAGTSETAAKARSDRRWIRRSS